MIVSDFSDHFKLARDVIEFAFSDHLKLTIFLIEFVFFKTDERLLTDVVEFELKPIQT